MHGQVTFADGTPVRGGTIEFTSREHKVSSVGQIKQDGTFVLTTNTQGDGTVAGKHDVIVLQGNLPIGYGASHAHGRSVPEKYGSYSSSGLTAEVEQSTKNDINLVLDGS